MNHVGGAFVLGILGGMAGAFFITVGTYMSFCRKKVITSDTRKIIETGIYGFTTISVMVGLVCLVGECKPLPTYTEAQLKSEETDMYNTWVCDEDQYNPLATLFLNTEATTIKSLFHFSSSYVIEQHHLLLFGLTWYLFTITTYGVWCPSGLFLPGIIMGGSMGRLYTVGIQRW